MRTLPAWLLLALTLPVATAGCKALLGDDDDDTASGDDDDAVTLPDLSAIIAAPSDTFFLDSAGLAQVSRAHPYKGAGTACAHQGAHTHFADTGVEHTIDLYAVADGVVRRVDPCFNIGATDRYGLDLAFATTGGSELLFGYSIEPQDGTPCAGNPSAYAPYLLVAEGDSVVKGQLIARMLKTASGSDGAHVHFHVQKSGGGAFACPNIFTATVTSSFGAHYGSETCNATPFGASTFCYKPDAGEDLTGLLTIP